MSEKMLSLARLALIALGLVLLGVNIFLDSAVDITLPLVFLMLGAGFLLLVFAISRTSPWGALFYIPAALLTAFGLVFLVNVITGDWNSWAYAWLLLVAGAGVGLALTARHMGWPRLYFLTGVWLAAGGVTLFALFGAIAGGLFIRVIAPVLLVLGGLSLYWIRPEWLPGRAALSARAREPEESAARTALAKEAVAGTAVAETAAAVPAEGELPLVGAVQNLQPLVEPLSPREVEVLRLIEQGLSNAEIASRLVLAQSTVKSHINSLYGKMGVQTRVQALNRARELGLI